MNREVPVTAAVIAIIVLVLIAGLLLMRAGTGKSAAVGAGGQVSAEVVKKAQDALTRTHGDKSQMTPDERTAFDAAVKAGRVMDPTMTAPPRMGPGGGMPGGPAGFPPSNMRGPR